MTRKVRLGDDTPASSPAQTEMEPRSSKPRYIPSGSNSFGRDFNADRQKPFANEANMLHMFTDGSCHPNPGPGGWGVLLIWNGIEKQAYGGQARQTNNTMELTAILKALELRKRDVATIIYSDSQYAINCVTAWWKGWKRNGWVTNSGQPVKNQGLIEQITGLITPKVQFRWVKGHVGIKHNEAVDQLAGLGRKKFGHLSTGGSVIE